MQCLGDLFSGDACIVVLFLETYAMNNFFVAETHAMRLYGNCHWILVTHLSASRRTLGCAFNPSATLRASLSTCHFQLSTCHLPLATNRCNHTFLLNNSY